MDNVSLDICRVRNLGQGAFEVEIPTWRPTNVLSKENTQIWHKMIVSFEVVNAGFISGDMIEADLKAIDQKNPYLPLRSMNPQIVDYRRRNMGTFAPVKRVEKRPKAEVEQIREAIMFRTSTDFNIDFTVYYKGV
jgi:MFS superfamily sulfate permease-like transporter